MKAWWVCLFFLLVTLSISVFFLACGDDDDDDNDDNDSGDDDDSGNDDDSGDDDTGDDDTGDDDDSDSGEFPICDNYGTPMNSGVMDSPVSIEATGIAVSYKNPGLIWVVNEYGDGPIIYAIRTDGTYLGKVVLDGATKWDWEDLSVSFCEKEECLYVGDIGQLHHDATHPWTVYKVTEPMVDTSKPFNEIALNDWEKTDFNFPSDPVDLEGMAIHPEGDVFLFSREKAGYTQVFKLPIQNSYGVVTLTHLGYLELGDNVQSCTGADIHRNGARLLVRTDQTVFEWRLGSSESFENIFTGNRIEVPKGIEFDGQSIAYDPMDGSYYHLSAEVDAPIFNIPCQKQY